MATASVMNLLHEGVPITLLCDLVSIGDPDSMQINSIERPADDPVWQQAARDTKAARRETA